MLLHIQTVDMAERGDREVPAQRLCMGTQGTVARSHLPCSPILSPCFSYRNSQQGGGVRVPHTPSEQATLREVCVQTFSACFLRLASPCYDVGNVLVFLVLVFS